MAQEEFKAETLVQTSRRQEAQRVELTFEDAQGARLVLSLPARVAADLLVPVLAQFSSETARPPGAPEFSQNVKDWRVGRSNEEPKVVFAMNDDPLYAMTVRDAKKFWREIREEAEIVDRRSPPTRQ
jgi:hypothetical protein